MKVAQFKMVGYETGMRTVWSFDRMNDDGTIPGYIRTSEWVEVDFPARIDDGRIPEEVSQIDAKLEEVKADFVKKVAALEEVRAKLLALTDQRERA